MSERRSDSFYGPVTVRGDAHLAAACAAAPGRDDAEDRFVIEPEHGVWAVVDGLGGHEGAGLAATLAAAALHRCAPSRALGARDWLVAAFAAAEDDISRHARGDPPRRHMGVSMVVACVRDRQLWVAHVGDARAYLHGRRGLRRLTQDHTGAGELLQAGLIDEAEVARHPARQPLLRVIGGNKRTEEPVMARHWPDGRDVLLLCSDGVWAFLPPAPMAALLAQDGSAPQRARALVEAAREAGSTDDACAVVCVLATRDGLEVPDAAA